MLNTLNINDYLGKSALDILKEVPFKEWPVQRSVERDLDEPIIAYCFKKDGLELNCDQNEKIQVIFLYSEKYGGFDEDLLAFPFSLARKEVLERFGKPSESREKISDPILGEYGASDRFSLTGLEMHVEYRTDADQIKNITLMLPEVTP